MKAKKKAIVCVSNDLVTDNRVSKTCLVLQELNFEVILVGRIKKNSPEMNPRPYRTKRMKLLFEKGPLFYLALNLRLFFFLLFKKTDLIFSNDLDTLLPAFTAHVLKRNSRIIYDTHELFTEVSELAESPFKRKIWLRIEKWIFPKLKTVITVNESIAEIYSKTYKLPVHVVRNIPSKREVSGGLDRKELHLNENDFILIIQGSGLNKDRGIEECILSMKYCEHCILLIVGDGDILPLAKNLVKTNELSELVKFIPRKPYEDLMKITELADLGLLMDKNTNKNHEYALPNKLFDYMHAGTPILSNKLKEIERFIMKHDIGIINDDLSPEGIAKAIMNYKNDINLQQRLRENCIATSQIENWSFEKKKLVNAIETKN